jgi:MSHA biogenesis protein MshE
MYAKMGITTVDEVLKLIEMVADERSIPQTDQTETIEQELTQELTQVMVDVPPNKGSSDETPQSSGFSFELEPSDQPLGGNDGTV